MTELETRERIDAQAADWVARDALSSMDAAGEAELAAWLAADRRHAGAYLRAQASYHVLEGAVAARTLPIAGNDDLPLSATRRCWAIPRRAVGAGLAIAACAVAGLFLGVPALRAPAPPSARELALADGSSVALAADGAVTARMSAGLRQITLERGAATFHVAKDRQRPFVVRSGLVYAEATGTVYSVRRVGAQGGAVRVREGSVRVWREGARDRAVMLHAGNALTIDPAIQSVAAPASFWFEDISIADAAKRFNQVNAVRIVIADPATGRVPIVGRFRSDRPDQFAKAAATLSGTRVREQHGTLVIGKP
ncbi:FecR family protein [Sphingomonas sp. S2-65]|uniref:FecR family protein n=1 Tax=Sphingomonas sp. S2-65 TaxID=2903960 RepID=UPI001F460469|nr:FecR domain-containing protein [Sphingomonas sp. S2-65]UYY59503.1 FecR domain-containing protein [Sphingomonas sp. S2-65]